MSVSACAAEVKVEEMQAQAAAGNSEASLDLFHFFLTQKNDPTEAAFWLRLGAEQGNCAAMTEYGRLLGGGMQDQVGREAWFEKARKKGCDMSKLTPASSKQR